MFDDIPETYRNQTADNEEEGWRYTQGDKNARRPPELLTRDHVARCIMREVKAGRGSPHGGVFLDIAWIKKKLPDAEAHIKRKLPSMYHQFKELADIDITKEPMEVGPTTHYIMGGMRVDARHADVDDAGPVRRGRMRRRHQRRQPARRQLAVRPARLRQARRRVRGAVRAAEHGAPASIDGRRSSARRRGAAARSSADRRGENPYTVQSALQDMMQSLVGIVRTEAEMQQALHGARRRSRRAPRERGGHRPSRVQPGWHTAIDLRQPADGVRSDHAIGDRAQGEPRRTLPRGLSRTRPRNSRRSTSSRAGRADGSMEVRRVPIPPMPAELKQIIEEQQ